ncbi:hypothetical protein TPENAI_60893 [Tenacibaculum litopenaei]|uniref:hypothetical protein n=1 Tax=Tenacibaculum litopenaei TaxID=396016 RepID=UPI0038953823
MSEVGQRLKTLIKSSGYTNKKFAELAEVAPNYISILIRKGEISDKFKYSITKIIPNANIDWLETGEGSPLLEENEGQTLFEQGNSTNTIKVGNIEVNVDEFALAAAQNMDLLKEKPVFYNTFVIEAIKLIKEAQKGDGTIDVSKLVGRS